MQYKIIATELLVIAAILWINFRIIPRARPNTTGE